MRWGGGGGGGGGLPAVCLVGAVALAASGPSASAQSFDNFGEGPLEGFEFDAETPEGTDVPSLGEGGSAAR